jgi:GAF domain-containing protein
MDSGFSGECIRTGKALRCDDSEADPHVDAATCRRLGIRSIVAAPIRYERAVVGLVEVFSPQCFAFDEGDLAVLERLAQTALLMLSQAQLFKRA